MTSQRQIEANRKNAARSSGPKSAEGKAKVARNALKHGLAGHGVILPGEAAGQIQERKGHWRKDYRPDSPSQEWLFERICIESVRADLCLHQVIALRDEAATQAGESWDDDRALDAEELGAAIGRKPELVQPKLLRSKHGARWLLARWDELERQLERNGEWTGSATTRALDLLGVPIEARDGVWERLAADGHRQAIRAQVEAIEERLDSYLADRDDRAKVDAMVGLGAEGPDLRRVLRYESAALRRLQGWTRELRRLQKPASASMGRDRRGPREFGRPSADDQSAASAARAPSPTGPRPDDDGPRPGTLAPRDGGVRPISKAFPKPLDARREPPTANVRTSPMGPPSATTANRQQRRAQAAILRRSHRA